MKREIKFRAFDPETKEWIYFVLNSTHSTWELDIINRLAINGVKWYEFTGLLDKQGREIYEGDILERFAIVQKGANPRKRSVVEWNLYHWDGINQWMQSEVIGNIHENPELIS